MADDIRFRVHEVLTGEPVGTLDPKSFKFNDPVFGAGSLEAAVTIPAGRDVGSLKRKTSPDQVQLLCTLGNSILWGGVINYRKRTPGRQELHIKAQHWKAWYYTRLFTERTEYSGDENQIAYSLMDYAVSEPGTPALYRGGANSGKTRQLTVEPWWSVGQAMDALQSRDGAFEWSIGLRMGSQTGLPEQFLELWPQGAARGNPTLLFLDQSQSTNNISVGEVPEDASERRPRVWATGETNESGHQSVAKDEEPDLDEDVILLRETVTNWSGVTDPATLFEHARSERIARSAPVTQLPVDHPYDSPSVADYRSGDRARLRIKDAWDDIDLRGVRILDRAISKSEKSATIATVVLDLLDVKEPEAS